MDPVRSSYKIETQTEFKPDGCFKNQPGTNSSKYYPKMIN